MLRRTIVLALCGSLLAAAPHHTLAQNLGVTALPMQGVVDARDVHAVNAEVAQLTADSQRLESESSQLMPRRDELRARARQQTRWLYHLTQESTLVGHGSPEMLLDHAARTERLRHVLHRTLRELESIERRSGTLEADRTRVARLLEAALAHKRELDVTQRASALAHGPPYAGTTAGPSVTVYGGAPAAGLLLDGFGASMGRLLFPVPGRAEVRRAWREGADGPGVEVRCAAGTPVRAVFPGRVAFADRYGAYGEVVILDHGDHYYTVSAGLGRVLVQVGQELPQGAPLGVVGNGGGEPLVFFELRRGSETLDPVPWLGL